MECVANTCRYRCRKFLLGNIHNTSSDNYFFCSDTPIISEAQSYGVQGKSKRGYCLIVPAIEEDPSHIIRCDLGTKRNQISLKHGFNSFLAFIRTLNAVGTVCAVASFAIQSGREALAIPGKYKVLR